MRVIVRDARPEDKPYVLEFTKRTWEDWEEGDYIKYVFDEWISDKNSIFLSAELDGRVVGILRMRFLPDGSGWLEGLRVDPNFRRRGIASEMNKVIIARGLERGINVFRGAIHEENEPSKKLAKKLGFSFYENMWCTLYLKRLGCLDGVGVNLLQCDDVDETWEKIVSSKYFELGGGLFALNWAWFKLNKDILKDLLSRKVIYCAASKNLDYLALYYFRTRRDGLKVLELNFFIGEDILKLVKSFEEMFKGKIDAIRLVYPNGLFEEKIFEKCDYELDRWLIFEYKK